MCRRHCPGTVSSCPGIGFLCTQKQRGLLNLEPEYQRGFVWDITASSRLVETILLGLPVPEVGVILPAHHQQNLKSKASHLPPTVVGSKLNTPSTS